MDISLQKIAEMVGGEVVGEGTLLISGISGIKEARKGEITFLANAAYIPELSRTQASAVIVGKEFSEAPLPIVRVEDPYYAFSRVLTFFHTKDYRPRGISSLASLGERVQLGKDLSLYPFVTICDGAQIADRVTIYPGTCVGEGSEVGEETIIYPNVTIREGVIIGRRVIVHSGTVLGSDGFGYATHGGRHHKIPQVGSVIIEDDVEIGANVTVDRATMGRTIIKRGTKIDNLVQIAHNVSIGEHCLLVAQVGISGSTVVGNHVILAGQVGLVGHIAIGDHVIVGAQSGVANDVKANERVTGSPAIPHREWLRVQATLPHLPEMRKRMKALEEKVSQLQKLLERKSRGGKKD